MGEPRPTNAIAGYCVDIDGGTWHQDFEVCPHCRFGLWEDPATPGRGAYGEPVGVEHAFDSMGSRVDSTVESGDAKARNQKTAKEKA